MELHRRYCSYWQFNIGTDPGGSPLRVLILVAVYQRYRYWWHCIRGTDPGDRAPVSGTDLGGGGPKVAILTAAGRGHETV